MLFQTAPTILPPDVSSQVDYRTIHEASFEEERSNVFITCMNRNLSSDTKPVIDVNFMGMVLDLEETRKIMSWALSRCWGRRAMNGKRHSDALAPFEHVFSRQLFTQVNFSLIVALGQMCRI